MHFWREVFFQALPERYSFSIWKTLFSRCFCTILLWNGPFSSDSSSQRCPPPSPLGPPVGPPCSLRYQVSRETDALAPSPFLKEMPKAKSELRDVGPKGM